MRIELLTCEVFLAGLVSGSIFVMVPLLLAGLGETISERAGVLNVGLEGVMLIGAYVGYVVALYSGSHSVGLLLGLAAGMATSLVVIVLCVWLGLDQIVVGVAILILTGGLTSVLQMMQFGATYPRLDTAAMLEIPLLADIPILGPSLFTQPVVVYLAFTLAGVVHALLYWTKPGLYLRAAGEKAEVVDTAGVSVMGMRSFAVLCMGALGGLGGAYMSVVATGIFMPFMIHGAGFIALVIAMLGRGRGWWVMLMSGLYGMAVSLVWGLQIAGVPIPIDVVHMAPFVLIIVILMIFCRGGTFLPAGLGLPYKRRGIR
jgi:simple sugar transport system permease protein